MNDINKIHYSENISWTLFDNEVFVFNEITNELSLLKGIIKDFWMLLSKTNDFDEITTILAKEYSKNADIINVKLLKKISELANKNLIIVEEVV